MRPIGVVGFFHVNTIRRRRSNKVTGVMMFRPSFAPPCPLCDLPPPPPLGADITIAAAGCRETGCKLILI